LRHTFDHYLKKEARVMQELVHHQKIGIARLQQSWQMLRQLLMNRDITIS